MICRGTPSGYDDLAVSPAPPHGRSASTGRRPSIPPSFDGDERFEIRSALGRGTSSVVYRAFDRQRGAEVALKVLSVQGSAEMLAFKREFRSMADVGTLQCLPKVIPDGVVR